MYSYRDHSTAMTSGSSPSSSPGWTPLPTPYAYDTSGSQTPYDNYQIGGISASSKKRKLPGGWWDDGAGSGSGRDSDTELGGGGGMHYDENGFVSAAQLRQIELMEQQQLRMQMQTHQAQRAQMNASSSITPHSFGRPTGIGSSDAGGGGFLGATSRSLMNHISPAIAQISQGVVQGLEAVAKAVHPGQVVAGGFGGGGGAGPSAGNDYDEGGRALGDAQRRYVSCLSCSAVSRIWLTLAS